MNSTKRLTAVLEEAYALEVGLVLFAANDLKERRAAYNISIKGKNTGAKQYVRSAYDSDRYIRRTPAFEQEVRGQIRAFDVHFPHVPPVARIAFVDGPVHLHDP